MQHREGPLAQIRVPWPGPDRCRHTSPISSGSTLPWLHSTAGSPASSSSNATASARRGSWETSASARSRRTSAPDFKEYGRTVCTHRLLGELTGTRGRYAARISARRSACAVPV